MYRDRHLAFGVKGVSRVEIKQMKSERDDPENQPAEVQDEITVREANRRGGLST